MGDPVCFLLCTDDELVFDRKWGKKDPSAKLLAQIRKPVEHRAELLREWGQKVMMRTTVVYSDSSVPRRVLSAWTQKAQEELIAKASVSKDRLFVLSCALQPYEVAFDSMPSLKRIPIAERANFTVDEDGSYVYWPGPDIHLDLDAIRSEIDPEARARAEAAKALHDSR